MGVARTMLTVRIESSGNPDFLVRTLKKKSTGASRSFTSSGFAQWEYYLHTASSSGKKKESNDIIWLHLEESLTQRLRYEISDFNLQTTEDLDSYVQKVTERTVSNIFAYSKCFPGSKVIVNTIPISPNTERGSEERNLKGYSHFEALEKVNATICSTANQLANVYIFDEDQVFRRYGWETLTDQRLWYLSKSRLNKKGLDTVSTAFLAVLENLYTPRKKCIVLDLDNTLWRGVVGEDGIDGIGLSNDGPDSSYHDFQRALLSMHSRGILLAVSSKNNLDDALKVFDHHPDMLIQKKHLSSIRINWQDKASNIREIAEELNIGLESLCFMDDSPTECEWVRKSLPQVETILLPSEPAYYLEVLLAVRSLNPVAVTDSDLKRNETVQRDIDRRELKKVAPSYQDYLKSLAIEVHVEAMSTENLPRIHQLFMKTNQFNLTTERLDQEVIQEMSKDKNYRVFCAKLKDRFGDYGIIGCCIFRLDSDQSLHVEHFLMSCRALGRDVEKAFLVELLRKHLKNPKSVVKGYFRPTKRNMPTIGFYKDLGLRMEKEDTDGSKVYTAALSEITYDNILSVSIG